MNEKSNNEVALAALPVGAVKNLIVLCCLLLSGLEMPEKSRFVQSNFSVPEAFGLVTVSP